MTEQVAPETEEKMSPSEYFEIIKGKKQKAGLDGLDRVYDNALTLMQKYVTTGQLTGARKLMFHLESLEKEKEVIRAGIDTFVYRDDIEEYIQTVASDVVKIIELERYEREVPDEVVESMSKVKHLFDEFYVVFTDYTGEMERKVEKERRDKDPILFGAFIDRPTNTVIDRFYFIGDWEDEYCDLTLDKMVSEFKKKKDREISFDLSLPADLDELKSQLQTLEESKSNGIRKTSNVTKKKKSFFKNIKTFIGMK